MVTDGNTLVTKSKTLMTKGNTLVTKRKTLVTKGNKKMIMGVNGNTLIQGGNVSQEKIKVGRNTLATHRS